MGLSQTLLRSDGSLSIPKTICLGRFFPTNLLCVVSDTFSRTPGQSAGEYILPGQMSFFLAVCTALVSATGTASHWSLGSFLLGALPKADDLCLVSVALVRPRFGADLRRFFLSVLNAKLSFQATMSPLLSMFPKPLSSRTGYFLSRLFVECLMCETSSSLLHHFPVS